MEVTSGLGEEEEVVTNGCLPVEGPGDERGRGSRELMRSTRDMNIRRIPLDKYRKAGPARKELVD